MTVGLVNTTIRVPNLPSGPLVDKDGFPTLEEQTFRQALVTLLQTYFGPEGLVAPTQTADNIAIIQDNTITNGTDIIKTCLYGTCLYNITANSIMFCINDGTGMPVFRTVTLT